MRQNLHELADLVRLAARVGVDVRLRAAPLPRLRRGDAARQLPPDARLRRRADADERGPGPHRGGVRRRPRSGRRATAIDLRLPHTDAAAAAARHARPRSAATGPGAAPTSATTAGPCRAAWWPRRTGSTSATRPQTASSRSGRARPTRRSAPASTRTTRRTSAGRAPSTTARSDGGTARRRIAILRALKLGDLLCTVPALRALRAAHPFAEIRLVGLPWATEFVHRYDGYLDGLFVLPGFPGFPERPFDARRSPASWTRSRPGRRTSCSRCTAAATSRTRWRCCWAVSRRPASTCPASTARTRRGSSPIRPTCPRSSRHLRLLEHLGIAPRARTKRCPSTKRIAMPSPSLPLDEAACLAQAGTSWSIPGASVPERRWPPERFAAVASDLAGRGLPVVLTGGTDRGRRHGVRASGDARADHRPDRAHQPRNARRAACPTRRSWSPTTRASCTSRRRIRTPLVAVHLTRKAGVGHPWTQTRYRVLPGGHARHTAATFSKRRCRCCAAAQPLAAWCRRAGQTPDAERGGPLATMRACDRYASSPGMSTAVTCCTSPRRRTRFFVPVRPGRPNPYGGLGGPFPWPSNVHEVPVEEIPGQEFDCILFQRPEQYLTRSVRDPLAGTAAAAAHLPGARSTARVAHRHPPRRRRSGRPARPRDPLQCADVGQRPHADPRHRARRHGAGARPLHRRPGTWDRRRQPPRAAWTAARTLTCSSRSRREVPLDLVGMGADELGGLGEVPHDRLPEHVARYRFFFNPDPLHQPRAGRAGGDDDRRADRRAGDDRDGHDH